MGLKKRTTPTGFNIFLVNPEKCLVVKFSSHTKKFGISIAYSVEPKISIPINLIHVNCSVIKDATPSLRASITPPQKTSLFVYITICFLFRNAVSRPEYSIPIYAIRHTSIFSREPYK